VQRHVTVDRSRVRLVLARLDAGQPQAGYFFAEHISRAQLHALPNTGHWVQLEQPERFRAQVELFLTEDIR